MDSNALRVMAARVEFDLVTVIEGWSGRSRMGVAPRDNLSNQSQDMVFYENN